MLWDHFNTDWQALNKVNLVTILIVTPIEFHLPVVTSTSDYAKELLSRYPFVLVSAQQQTVGRGRNGKRWLGEHGVNLYCSFGMLHGTPPTVSDLSSYMARGSLACIDIVRALIGVEKVRMKYPNDVQVVENNQWSKICGILVEHEYHGKNCTSTTVGIGINVNQTAFSDTITQPCTSLLLQGIQTTVDEVLRSLIDSFSRWRLVETDKVMTRWSDELMRTSHGIQIVGVEGSWNVLRLHEDGRLILQNDVSRIERTISDGDTLRYPN